MEFDREDAWELLTTHTQKDHLLKHALAVEAAMRAYARRFDEDEEKWAVTGLLHDMDYEQHPTQEEHPYVGVKILEEQGYPEDVRRAVLAHAPYTGVPRETKLAKALFVFGRVMGLSAHYFEEIMTQSPMRRINFAQAVYKGTPERPFPIR